MSHREVRIKLLNRLPEIEKLRCEIEKFSQTCGLSAKALSELHLILEEVLANIISYAYVDDRIHEIEVRADYKDGEVTLEVEDDGRSFNPLQVPAPDMESPLERRKAGGLGLYFVRRYSNNLEYRRHGNRNRLIIKKRVEGQGP